MNPKRIADNIKKTMAEKNMDSIDLMNATGAQPLTMQRWLSGHRTITASGLYRVAKALGVTMDSLMEGFEDE